MDLSLCLNRSGPLPKSIWAFAFTICFAQVVYKPSEQAIVDSERSNDRKFSFLSSETKPDYRPLAERGSSKDNINEICLLSSLLLLLLPSLYYKLN